MTLTTALVVPEEARVMFWAAPWPSRHSFPEGPSTVMDNLGPSGQAVGGAGGITDSLEGVVILLMIHAHHKHGGIMTLLAPPSREPQLSAW